jgi:hypothetical protein
VGSSEPLQSSRVLDSNGFFRGRVARVERRSQRDQEEGLRGRNDVANVIIVADRVTEFVASRRLVGDPFEDVGRLVCR